MIYSEISHNHFPLQRTLRACYLQCFKDFHTVHLPLSRTPICFFLTGFPPSLFCFSVCFFLLSVTKGTIRFLAYTVLLRLFTLSFLLLCHLGILGYHPIFKKLVVIAFRIWQKTLQKISKTQIKKSSLWIFNPLHCSCFTLNLCLEFCLCCTILLRLILIGFFSSHVSGACVPWCCISALHCICQLAAEISCEGRPFLSFGGNSLGVQTFAPSALVLYSVNTICAFHFSRLLFHYAPSHPAETPLAVSSLPPITSCSVPSCLGPLQTWRILHQGPVFL